MKEETNFFLIAAWNKVVRKLNFLFFFFWQKKLYNITGIFLSFFFAYITNILILYNKNHFMDL